MAHATAASALSRSTDLSDWTLLNSTEANRHPSTTPSATDSQPGHPFITITHSTPPAPASSGTTSGELATCPQMGVQEQLRASAVLAIQEQLAPVLAQLHQIGLQRQNDLQQYTRDRERFTLEIRTLHGRAAEQGALVDQLQSQVTILRSTNSEQSDRIHAQSIQIEELTVLSREKDGRIDRLTAALSDQRGELDRANRSITTQQTRIEQLVIEAAQKDLDNQKLSGEVTRLNQRVDELNNVQAQLIALNAQRESQDALIAQLNQSLADTQRVAAEAQQALERSQQTILDNQRTIQAVRQEATTATRQFQQQHIVAAQLSNANTRLKRDVKNFKEEAETLRRELAQQKVQLEARIAELESSEAALEISLAQKQAEVDEARRLLTEEEGKCRNAERFGLGLLAILAAPIGLTNHVTDWAEKNRQIAPTLTYIFDQRQAEFRKIASKQLPEVRSTLTICREQYALVTQELNGVMPDLPLVEVEAT